MDRIPARVINFPSRLIGTNADAVVGGDGSNGEHRVRPGGMGGRHGGLCLRHVAQVLKPAL
jgi:hypothetical protein